MRDVFLKSTDAPANPRIFKKRVKPTQNIGAAAAGVREVAIEKVGGQPLDHPIAEDCPETGYLTGALIKVK